MIKLITFDLWNTLISGKSMEKQRAYRIDYLYELLNKNNIKTTKEQIDNAIKLSWNYFMNEWENRHYTPNASAMMNIFFENIDSEINSKLKEHIIHFMQSSLLDIEQTEIDGVRELLNNLYDKYHLAIISDTGFTPGKYLRLLLKKMDLYRYFSFFAFSDEIGVSKPDERIFDYVLNYFDILPKQAIHIGDLLKTDVEGALNKGMKSVHFTNDIFIEENCKTKADFSTKRADKILDFVLSIS